MSAASLARCRIADGKVGRLREWYAKLEHRTDEVVETLQHEGVYTETAFVGIDDGQPYLYGYMEAEDLNAADEAGDEEAYEIDREHHAVLEDCLIGEWEQFELLGHLTNPDRD